MWLVWQRTLLLSTTCSTKSPFLSSAFSPYLSASFEASPLLFWKAIGCSPFLVTSSFHWPNESFTSLVLLSWMSESRNGFSSNKRPVRKKKKKITICIPLFLSVSQTFLSLTHIPISVDYFVLKGFSRTQAKLEAPLSHPPPDSLHFCPQNPEQNSPKLQKCQFLKGPGWARASQKEKISFSLMDLHLQHQSWTAWQKPKR